MEAARQAGLEKMKKTRALKTADKKSTEGMTALGAVTEAYGSSYWLCGMKSKNILIWYLWIHM